MSQQNCCYTRMKFAPEMLNILSIEGWIMPWWGYALLTLAVFLAIRWVMVSKALAKQQPNVAAMANVAPLLMRSKMLMDYIDQSQHFDIDDDERLAGIEQLEENKEKMVAAIRSGVDAGGLVYIRHWLDYNDLVLDCYKQAPLSPLRPGDEEKRSKLLKRREDLECRANQIVSANPTPSFYRMLFTGVPKVRDID